MKVRAAKYLTLFLFISSIPLFADVTVRLPKESIQKCVSKDGEVFSCYYDQSLCYIPEAVGPLKDRTEYSLKPCKGAPLVLTQQQELRLQDEKLSRDTLLSRCRMLQRNYLSGEQSDHSENNLWNLVECMKIEADMEYEPEKEKSLYEKIISLLDLLLKYPSSKTKAHIELGMIYETYFQNYQTAYQHYKAIPVQEHPFVLVSMAKTACSATYPEKSNKGMRHYLEAIEKEVLEVDIDNLKPEKLHLNNVLESCGYKHLIPITDQQKWLLVKPGERDLKKTLRFIRRHL